MQRGSRGGQGLNASPECMLSRWHKPSEKACIFFYYFFFFFASVSALRVKVPGSELALFPQVSAGDIAQAAEFWTAGTEEQHGKRRRREENLS